MKKTLSFSTKPTTQPDRSPDEWVMNRQVGAAPVEAESTKRLTIDVSASLHVRMRSRCALNGIRMADEEGGQQSEGR